jgi:glycosyltransferase involved in cell wall biosynthesis
VRVLLWHVHGSWATAFVQGAHDYVVPVLPDRGPDGRGRARTWDWPASVVELPPDRLAGSRPDVVLLQRPGEARLLQEWTGLRAGVDVPAVYVEHDTPRGDVDGWRHHLADQTRIPVVHVTGFNRSMWDNGRADARVVEHGVLDPGPLWTGELERLSMSVNEPVRRWRVAGMDLAADVARRIADVAPVDVYGMGSDGVVAADAAFADGKHEDLPQHALHRAMAERRAYLHTYRWTSLGLSLLEAMVLGSPVLVLSATAAPEAVPPGAGRVSSDPAVLADAARALLHDPAEAAGRGRAARAHVLEHFALPRFLRDWDRLLEEVV